MAQLCHSLSLVIIFPVCHFFTCFLICGFFILYHIVSLSTVPCESWFEKSLLFIFTCKKHINQNVILRIDRKQTQYKLQISAHVFNNGAGNEGLDEDALEQDELEQDELEQDELMICFYEFVSLVSVTANREQSSQPDVILWLMRRKLERLPVSSLLCNSTVHTM